MTLIRRYLGQFVAYAVFAALLGYFSIKPSYTYFPADKAQLKLSLSHNGQRKEKCRPRTAKELQRYPNVTTLPPVCPRERFPVRVAVWLDGRPLYDRTVAPVGLSGDGASYFYRTFAIAPGRYRLRFQLNDAGGGAEGEVSLEQELVLQAGLVTVIDYEAKSGGLIVH
jgi:hypothetical protein